MIINDSRSFDKTPDPGVPSEVEQLRTLIYTDDLTGLYNRRFFRQCIAEQKTESDTAHVPFALLMMDIDYFKQMNDSYGHAVGDAVLIKIAKVLQEELREKGWVFRYAGDEFVGLLRNCHEEQARSFCTRILNQTALCFRQPDPNFPLRNVTLSIGFAVYPNDSARISELLEISDHALYTSKRKGRNCFTSAQEVAILEKAQAEDWPIKVQCQSLVGRQKEWNLLQHHFSECKNGRGRLLLLTGEAGIGKSRLLYHFTRRQRTGDYNILYGECAEGTLIHSYAPVRNAFKKGFEAKDPATVNVYRGLDPHYRSELIGLVPQFDRFEKKPLATAKSPDRFFLLESILMLLQGLSHQLPTVLILEDIHWSDEATLNLIQYLARNIRNERILMIATFREEEALYSNLPSVIQNMSRENLFETISLKPLSSEETGIMLEEIFRGYTIFPSFKQWIYQETEGNPFYVEELLKLLLEEGYIRRFDHEIELQKPEKFVLPYSIRALIQRRTSRLDDSLQRVLGYASIIGYEFDLCILLKLIEENEGYLLDLLDHLVKMQLIRETPETGEERFAFTHNKIRDVIYEDMGVIKRRKFHQRVGELLENMHRQDVQLYAEDLAYHFERAGDTLRACTYSLEAGKKALQIHAYQDALMHFNRCFQYKDLHRELVGSCPPEQLAELFTYKGLTLEALGLWDEAVRCYELLCSLKDANASPSFEVDGLNHLSRVFYKRDEFSKSLKLAEQALALANQIQYFPGILSSYDNLGKNYWRICNYDEALSTMKSAVEMAEWQEEPGLKANFLNSAGIVYLEQSDYSQAFAHFQQALEIFQQRNDKPGIIESLVNISIIRHLQGDLHEARQHVVNAFAMAQEIGDPFSIANCSVNQAELEYKLAHYEMGGRLNERAGRIYNELDHSLGLTYYLENEAQLQMVKGNLDAALEAILKAKGISSQKRFLKRDVELLRNEAGIRYFLAQYSETLQILDQIRMQCTVVRDPLTNAEAELKRGFVYFALQDLQKASEIWRGCLQTVPNIPAAEFHFWKTAAAAFLAAFEKKEEEVAVLHNELRMLAEKTEYGYLITTSHLLCAYQFQILNRLQEALSAAQQSEKQAESYGQDLWMTRSKMKIFELQEQIEHAVDAGKVLELLAVAKQQGQNDIISRCYRLLSHRDSEDEKLREEWNRHWDQWQDQIPQPYRTKFQPA